MAAECSAFIYCLRLGRENKTSPSRKKRAGFHRELRLEGLESANDYKGPAVVKGRSEGGLRMGGLESTEKNN